MTGVFGNRYADVYDALYAEKDYTAECDLLESIFRKAGRPVASLLDLGCGTGRHAAELATRGYEIVGVDRSAAMLERARARIPAEAASRVSFVEADISSLRLERRFDAVVCMFAVLGYLIDDGDLRATLANVRRHLEPGGVFVFDVWYGPAVESIGPDSRTKVVRDGVDEVERKAQGFLEPGRSVCTVAYDVTRRGPGHPPAITHEEHRMRYFDEPELRSLLAEAGLELRSLTAFPAVEQAPSVESWNVLAVAAG